MTITGRPIPSPPPGERPPQRESPATETFWDFKASHFVTATLTFALFVVAAFQLCTYRRQADIMDKQADISNDQLAFQESVSRAWIRANVALGGPVIFTEWASDKFINLQLSFDVKNFGQVPAVNIRIMTAIDRADGTDREPRLKRLQESMCKSARDVADSDQIGGSVAFPSEPITIKSGSGTGGLYRDGNPGALAVVGCIDYTFANSKHGQTGFRKILGRVEGKIVGGIPFVSGQPYTDTTPIPQDLLAQGYPRDPAKYARVPTDGLYFEEFEGGNYAK